MGPPFVGNTALLRPFSWGVGLWGGVPSDSHDVCVCVCVSGVTSESGRGNC